jgi:hypothetical protein
MKLLRIIKNYLTRSIREKSNLLIATLRWLFIKGRAKCSGEMGSIGKAGFLSDIGYQTGGILQ